MPSNVRTAQSQPSQTNGVRGTSAPAQTIDPIVEGRQIAKDTVPTIVRRLIAIATAARPPRNANSALHAAKEVLAFAQGLSEATASNASQVVKLVLATDLERELERRKSS